MTPYQRAVAYLKMHSAAHDAAVQAHVFLLLSSDTSADTFCDTIPSIRGDAGWKWLESASLYAVFVRLTALWTYDQRLLDGVCMAKIAKLLVACEQAVGGPYMSAFDDDIVKANSAILQFFTLCGSPLPNLVKFVANAPVRSAFEMLPLVVPVRAVKKIAYLAPVLDQDKMAAMLIDDAPDKTWVRATQQADGSWGNDYVCTALGATLLEMSESVQATLSHYHDVTWQVQRDIELLDAPLRSVAQTLQKNIVASKSYEEVVTLCGAFVESLRSPLSTTNEELMRLTQANFYFWMAAMAYDDIIDDERSPHELPVVSVLQRQAVALFSVSSSNLTQSCFDRIDSANAWELAHCRYVVSGSNITVTRIPSFGNGRLFAHRAMGHILGPLIVLEQTKAIRRQKHMVHEALSHYLAARQISDDLHDWLHDIRRGHVNFVGAHLLRRLRITPGEYDILALSERMSLSFFNGGMKDACEKMVWHATKARHYLVKSELFLADSPLYIFLARLEEKASAALMTAHEQRRFADEYEK